MLAALNQTKFSQNTVVIFASDHGDMLGDQDLSTKKAFMYDACTRLPMIIHYPKQIDNRVEDAPCQLHDIAATVLTLAQYQQSEQMTGSRNLLSSEDLRQRGYVVCIHRNSGVGLTC